MSNKSELAALRERIEQLEAQLAPKPQAPAQPTTADVMRDTFGMDTGPTGKIIATPEQIAAHEASEKQKADIAAAAIAYAQKWNRENGVGFSGPSSSPADIRAVMEAQRDEHHDTVTAENTYRQDPHDE